MKRPRVNRRIRSAANQIERLESRRLLAATVVSQIPAQNIYGGQSFSPISLGTYFDDPTVTGTAVVLQTPLGNIPLVLTDSQTPQTVANFTQYVTSGAYANTIIHRSVPGFIVQGGGYSTSGDPIATNSTIPGEPGVSNTTGTIAMALSNGPDSATSQWFINLDNNDGTTANPNLDDTSDGGPFTAFGNVVYNGMSAVNAIANLPVVDDSAQNGDWSALPVQSGTNGATVASEPASNLVTINPEILPGGLTYSAVSSNPGLMTASVDSSGNLTLTPLTGGGTANITVTATDMGGGVVTSTFAADINDSNLVSIGVNNAKFCAYTDASGAAAVVTLRKGGSAALEFVGTGIFQVATGGGITVAGVSLGLASITTAGTTSASVLSLITRGGSGTVLIGAVTTDALKSFVAKGVTLEGNLNSSSSIGTLILGGAANGMISAVSIGNIEISGGISDALSLSSTGQSFGSFQAGSITGGTWTIAGAARSVAVKSVASWSPDFSQALKSLAVKGDFSGSVTAGSIGAVAISGAASNSQFDLTAAGVDIGKLAIKGAFSSSMVNAAGSIDAVSAGALMDSEIYAGIGALSNGLLLPASAGDFAALASIGSVKVKQSNHGESFSNSDIAAAMLGTLALGKLQTNNGGTPAGVAGESLKSLTARANKNFKLKRETNSANVAAILAAHGIVLGDIVIELFAPAP